ncbi:amino acid adenylation domain-containing protein [Scytonema sp. PRP1]|uniref:amino acid adenylation domain-containing protein n=1 Tax=Scytonema sp. PRP1 TaxID=3120513 RepID=UPI002FD6484E
MTNSTVEFLSHLSSLNINLENDGDRLRCHAPEGVLTPKLRQEIAGRKTEIIQLLQKAKQVKASHHLPIQRVPRDGELPLSFAQQRLWFLHQLSPDSSFNNMLLVLRLSGSLNVPALEKSLNELIRRHEVLRTTFPTVNGKPVQNIAPPPTLTLPVIDWQEGLSAQEQTAQIEQIAKSLASQPFDLAVGPLLQFTLLQLDEQEYIFLLKMHHIIYDGWSLNIFIRELSQLYEAYTQGLSYPLAELPIQYADFALWQRQWLQGDVLQKQLSYWQKQLADAPGLLSLPTDRPRPSVQTYHGAHQEFALSKELTVALQQLSQKESTTLFMTLLAAFQILLWRYSGQDDICIGTPIANRNRAEIERLIGFFVNTLVLRTHLGDNPSFRQLVSQVREVALGAYAHQDLPFELLVEALQLQRDLSHNPIFQVWFNLLNLGDNQLELSGLSVEFISIPEEASKFDLSLYVKEQKQGIKLELVYNSDLFNSDTIATMLLHYQTLLESIVADPEQKISTLPLLTETECYYLKSCGNFVYPSNPFITFDKQDIEQSIPARFQEQVRKYPDNIAVHTNNYHWTYSDLNYHANQVAQAILKQCTLKEERIALLFEHDAPMVAGILGVLQVGKTYVPLDPNYPSDRVVYILEDSQASAVLTNNKNLARAQELTKGFIPLINIDDISFTDSDNEVKLEISPDTIAYILYTSGSTGQPKGVIQNHRNVLHFIRNYTNNLHINERDRLTLLSSYSFDAAIVDIFSAILNGASLYPINIKEEGFKYLFEVLQQHHITIYHSTPTLYRHFIRSLVQDEKLNQIRLVVLGGEEVVKTDVDSYKEHFSEESIFVNCIGSTESSITMLYLLNQQTEITRNTVPVGYPVEETEIFLLNEAGEKTDIYGEIAIRSAYVALSYWQKPNLTQVAFLPDPEFSSRRIYRTGDLGRLRPDGSLEFLGRKDFQVKIRGFRIELGEIEAAIAQHPSVRETVVIATEDVSGDKQLVAYIVAIQTLTTNEIRHVLKQKLPEYMVPSSIVFLDSLPLTPNGKVNRRALPAPSISTRSDRFVVPRNQLELQLVQIWSKILKVNQVGVQDNFFDLGGHSLLVPYLIAQIKEQFGKDLPLITLFQNPTIEQLASIVQNDSVQNDSDSSSGSPLVAIQANGSKQPFFCVPGAGVYPFYLYNLATYLDQDQPFYSFQADGLDGKLEPITGIENIAARYIQGLQTVQSEGPYFLGGHSFGGKVAFEIAQQLLRQGDKVALVAIFDTPAPFYKQKQISADWDNARWLTEFAKVMEFEFAKNLGISDDTLKNLLPDEQLKYVLERLKMVNILPSDAQTTELNNLLQVLKANALVDYVPQQVYPTQITLFRANEVSSEELASKFPSEILEDLTWGWNKFSVEPVNVHFVPGDHMTMMAQPHVQVLAEQLKVCIEKARATMIY